MMLRLVTCDRKNYWLSSELFLVDILVWIIYTPQKTNIEI